MNVSALAATATTGGSVQWGDVATWVASVGTVLAVGVALLQVARERRARLIQETRDRADRHLAHASLISAWLGPGEPVPAELRREYNSPDLANRYNYRTPIYIHNSSAEPVYEIVTGIVFIQGGGGPRTLEEMLKARRQRRQYAAESVAKGEDISTEQLAFESGRPVTTASIVPPGTWRVWIEGQGWTRVLSGRGGVDVAFVDRAGANWIRRATGQLDELPESPLKYFHRYGLDGPYDFQTPEHTE